MGTGIDPALALDARALAGIRRDAQADPRAALGKAAGQFEALFLQMVLKQMRATLPQDGPLDSESMRTYTSMFDQQVAQHLSSRGLGLREAIEKQLARALPGAAGSAAATPAPAGEAAKDTLRRLGATAPPPLPAHAAKAATPAAARSASGLAQNVQGFVEQVRPHAEAAAKALGLPAHLLIAQAGLETGWGRSQPRNADGSASHNLFGVKAGSRWQGASVAAATTEVVAGVAVRAVERFRSYASPAEAFRDVAKVLGGDRYAAARASGQARDEAGYAQGLQRAGYATDPQYADKLTRAIRMVARHLAAPQGAAAGVPAAPQVSAAAADNRNEGSAI